MIGVSACVISFQEEDRVTACLESVAFCDEILVVDSGSTDATLARAEAAGARVVHRDFLGHSRQKQYAVECASHDWILSLDCDERVTRFLRWELEHRLADEPDGVAGFSVPRRNRYLGRWMRHGIFWPDRKLRIFDRRRARWGGTDPHDRVEADEGARVAELCSPIEHDSYRSFAEHRETVQRFASIAARALAAEGRRAGVASPALRSCGAFLKASLVELGFLDGWRGLLAAAMSARYDWLKYRELRRVASDVE